MRALPLLLATAALAGCSTQPAEPTLAQNEATARDAAEELKGADRMFGFPTETIGRLNQYGYRIGSYAASGNGFAAKGADITLSQSDAKTPNTGAVAITGPDAQVIGSIVFSLALTDDANADTAKKRLTDIIRAFLFQYGLKDDGALETIATEQATAGTIGTAPFAITVANGDSARTLTVTFRRPSATAPAEAWSAIPNNPDRIRQART